MHWIDWLIMFVPFSLVMALAVYARRYARDAVDFLAAGRVAGRCISGDFYAHASYRSACDVAAMGEAAGYAAALCAKEKTAPADFDGARVKAYMAGLGYEL